MSLLKINLKMYLIQQFGLISILTLARSSLPSETTTEYPAIELPEVHGEKFLYFGYGSNMLSKRIHMQNPSAVKIGVGVLKDYRLDFNGFTTRWNGAPCTIVPTSGAEVFGTLWEIDLSNLRDIDNQEGVHLGIYVPISVPISCLNGTDVIARAYHLVEQPLIDIKKLERSKIPSVRQPSKTYLKCLVKGAIETGIHEDYVNWLKSIKHNGCIEPRLDNYLDLANVELDCTLKTNCTCNSDVEL